MSDARVSATESLAIAEQLRRGPLEVVPGSGYTPNLDEIEWIKALIR